MIFFLKLLGYDFFNTENETPKNNNAESSSPKPEEVDPHLEHIKESLNNSHFGGLFTPDDTKRAIKVNIKDREFFAMVSTAFPMTSCRPSVQQLLRLKLVEADGLVGKSLYGGTPIKFKGYVENVPVNLGPLSIDMPMLVSENENFPYDIMIGMDAISSLSKHGFNFTFGSDFVGFGKHKIPMVQKRAFD